MGLVSFVFTLEETKETWGKQVLRPCLHGVGDPGLVGLVSFFHALGDTKPKETYPTKPGSPTPCKQGLGFTWSGGPRSSGVGFLCFHALGDTKPKETYPTKPGSPTPCKQGLSQFYFSSLAETSVMHVQSCCFANVNLLLSCSSRCRRRIRCLSSLIFRKEHIHKIN